MDTKLVYSVAEVADMLDIAVGTAYECVHRGELPSIKLGRRIVIPRKALQELLETETVINGRDLQDQRVRRW